ncbi:MAG TPA: BamA/TamA family outer membrane protein, partial [Chitinophagaceae bacterium]|nr:BamA/TamA family outer membrane protein [Chitinophagaceae bacterium]
PSIYYSNEDRIYVGLGYKIKKNQWRKYPFANEHDLSVHYSITQNDYSVFYKGIVNQLFGKWNLALNAHYDNMRWTNFYGPGNESIKITEVADFYRMRSRVWYGDLGMNRRNKHSLFGITGFYQKFSIINDPDRFVAKIYDQDKSDLEPHSFVGGRMDYDYQNFNNDVVPTKGFSLESALSYTKNLTQTDRSFWNLSGTANTFLPLFGKLGLAIRTGAATLRGEPEFYQLNWIGGSNRLRGFRRERFYGKTAFFNNAELRLIGNVRSFFFNGKAGLIGFYDAGRVWLPDEISDKWHTAYGGGILLAPFNKIAFSVTYGISDEGKTYHIRFNRSLF